MAASAMAYSLVERAFAIACDPGAREAPDDARRRGQAPFAPQPPRADAERALMSAANAWGACHMFLVLVDGDGDRGMDPNEWPMRLAAPWPCARRPRLRGARVPPRPRSPCRGAADHVWPRQTRLATEARAAAITAAAIEALAVAASARSLQTPFTQEARAGAIAAAAMEALAARVAAEGARRAKHTDGAGHAAGHGAGQGTGHGAGPGALVATLAVVARAPRPPGRPNTCLRLAHSDTADCATLENAAAMAAQRNR